MNKADKISLLSVGDGPESIDIYTSDEQGMVDWAGTFPAVYITVTLSGVLVQLGPFSLPAIYTQLTRSLKLPIKESK